jgi:ABC-type transporter Mla subunit MlaD
MKPQTADALRTISIVVLVIGILIFLWKLSVKIDSLNGHATSLLTTTNAAMENLRDAAAEARDASEQAKLAATEQRAYWNKTSLETYKTMAALRLTIVRTDESLNNVLLPKLATSLDATAALEASAASDLSDVTGKVDRTIDALRPEIDASIGATQAASAAMETASKTMADPAIHETLAHVDGVAGNLDATSGDIRQFVHRETTPVRGTWNVIKAFLRDFAGPAAQVATSVK